MHNYLRGNYNQGFSRLIMNTVDKLFMEMERKNVPRLKRICINMVNNLY